MKNRFCVENRRGFALIEVLVAIGIFLVFAIGIYSGIQFVFKVVYFSRLKILENAILGEQIEMVRNMPFESVGIVGGVPSGVLART
ncbi:MAG TPA: prepilin-type N-terminal cleavage/methylation domain-containing protein, partial [Candidatus Magasanikbacteria bacterium]|nr:prepilin-type N-terminal cleavage/methylation domain-containing protein [Candidatus Magasanikbacteria bacterium]